MIVPVTGGPMVSLWRLAAVMTDGERRCLCARPSLCVLRCRQKNNFGHYFLLSIFSYLLVLLTTVSQRKQKVWVTHKHALRHWRC